MRHGSSVVRAYGSLLLLAFFGYAAVGKRFAYLGVPPFYVAEILLATGVLLVAVTPLGAAFYAREARRSGTVLLLHAFLAWGASCTVPYLSTYGLDALRDSVLCGYALFAVVVCAVAGEVGGAEWLRRAYRSHARWFPFAAGLVLFLGLGLNADALGGDGELPLGVKPGDLGVHLAGIAAAVLVGLVPPGGLAWSLGFAGVLGFVAVQNRGGLLSFLAAASLAYVLGRGSTASLRRLAPRAAVALLVALPLLGAVGEIRGREVSVRQIGANLASCWSSDESSSDAGALAGTRTWRLLWWSKIVRDTFYGDAFWTGRGFGVNLADADGFQVASGALRSPHNSHLCILARTGVPGFAIWVALQGAWALGMARAWARSRRARREDWARSFAFLLCYWLAFQINAAFDVFFENPMGAVPFWCVFGAGLVVRRDFARALAAAPQLAKSSERNDAATESARTETAPSAFAASPLAS